LGAQGVSKKALAIASVTVWIVVKKIFIRTSKISNQMHPCDNLQNEFEME
jgi:hypothetical protein